MGKKIKFDFSDEEFQSIVMNILADIQTEMIILRKFYLKSISVILNESLESVEAEFKKEFESTRADVLAKNLSSYT